MCERFLRTMQDEFYAVAFRKKIYHTLEDLQTDVDTWITLYNEQRSHSGRYCYGKTPMQTFSDSIPLAKEKNAAELFFGQSLKLEGSSEAEAGPAGEQPARNNLTDGNDKAADFGSAALPPDHFYRHA